MIVILSSLFVQAGVMPPVNGIEQICRCPGDTVKCLQIVHETQKALKLCCLRQDDMHVTSSSVG